MKRITIHLDLETRDDVLYALRVSAALRALAIQSEKELDLPVLQVFETDHPETSTPISRTLVVVETFPAN